MKASWAEPVWGVVCLMLVWALDIWF